MKEFSWYTDEKPHISTYLNGAPKKLYLVVDGIAVIGRAVMHYKPNLKGGHRHNHIVNAHIRMQRCHICGEPIVKRCEVLGYRFFEFQCRSCKKAGYEEQAIIIGASFNGCKFEIRKRRK